MDAGQRISQRGHEIGDYGAAQLCVRGVSSLRVVDISIMPQVTSGNTNAPAMAIGDNAARLMMSEGHQR